MEARNAVRRGKYPPFVRQFAKCEIARAHPFAFRARHDDLAIVEKNFCLNLECPGCDPALLR